MKLVKDPVNQRSKDYSGYRNEQQAAEQGIRRSKELGSAAMQFIDRPHASQDHGRVQQCINQTQPAYPMIPGYPNAQSKEHQEAGHTCEPRDSPGELPGRQHLLVFLLEHESISPLLFLFIAAVSG
jgi:hypothetical protein